MHIFGKGVGTRSSTRQRATLIDYPEHCTGSIAKIIYQTRGDFEELCEHFTKRAVSSKNYEQLHTTVIRSFKHKVHPLAPLLVLPVAGRDVRVVKVEDCVHVRVREGARALDREVLGLLVYVVLGGT